MISNLTNQKRESDHQDQFMTIELKRVMIMINSSYGIKEEKVIILISVNDQSWEQSGNQRK